MLREATYHKSGVQLDEIRRRRIFNPLKSRYVSSDKISYGMPDELKPR